MMDEYLGMSLPGRFKLQMALKLKTKNIKKSIAAST